MIVIDYAARVIRDVMCDYCNFHSGIVLWNGLTRGGEDFCPSCATEFFGPDWTEL